MNERRKRRDESIKRDIAHAEELKKQELAERYKEPTTFEERFSRPPFPPPYGYDFGEPNRLIYGIIAKVEKELAEFIIQTYEKLEPNLKQYEAADRELATANMMAAVNQIAKVKADNFAAAERGDIPAIKDLPDTQTLEANIRHKRLVLREAQRAIGKACLPAITEMGERIKLAARTLAEQMNKEETEKAKAYGVKFQPSVLLCKVVNAGFFFPEFVKCCFIPGCTDPRRFMKQFLPTDYVYVPKTEQTQS